MKVTLFLSCNLFNNNYRLNYLPMVVNLTAKVNGVRELVNGWRYEIYDLVSVAHMFSAALDESVHLWHCCT